MCLRSVCLLFSVGLLDSVVLIIDFVVGFVFRLILAYDFGIRFLCLKLGFNEFGV